MTNFVLYVLVITVRMFGSRFVFQATLRITRITLRRLVLLPVIGFAQVHSGLRRRLQIETGCPRCILVDVFFIAEVPRRPRRLGNVWRPGGLLRKVENPVLTRTPGGPLPLEAERGLRRTPAVPRRPGVTGGVPGGGGRLPVVGIRRVHRAVVAEARTPGGRGAGRRRRVVRRLPRRGRPPGGPGRVAPGEGAAGRAVDLHLQA